MSEKSLFEINKNSKYLHLRQFPSKVCYDIARKSFRDQSIKAYFPSRHAKDWRAHRERGQQSANGGHYLELYLRLLLKDGGSQARQS